MEQPTRLRITVTGPDGRPLPKASVTVETEKPATTGAGPGVFDLDLPSGPHRVTVSHRGMEPEQRTVEVGESPRQESFVLGKKGSATYRMGGIRVPFEPRPELIAVSLVGDRDPARPARVDARAAELGLTPVDVPEPTRSSRVYVYRFRDQPDAERRREVLARLARDEDVRYAGDLTTLDERGSAFVTDEFVVGVDPAADRKQIADRLAASGWEIVRWLPYVEGGVLVRHRDRMGYEALAATEGMTDDDAVRWVEPNLVSTAVEDFTPDDFLLGSQPHLTLLQAEDAWDITTGSDDIIVAVADSGCDIDHPDFDAPGKIYSPYDFVNLDSDPEGGTHGTKSTGIVGALADNAEGVAGVAPGCRIMPIRYPSGGTDTDYADMYIWAAGLDPGSATAGFPAVITPGADVISSSYGLYQNSLSAVMQGAFDTITNQGRGGRGCVVVFSVGNDNQDFTVAPARQWAAYGRTIAVAASAIAPPDGAEVKISSSNFGPNLDVCAPGGGPAGGSEARTMTTVDVDEGDTAGTSGGTSNDYDDFGQTSCACPQVSGVAALVLSVRPDLSWSEVRDLLRSTADRIDTANTDPVGQWVDNDGDGVAEFSNWYGFGRVNARTALCRAIEEIEIETSSLSFLDVVAGETAARAVRVRVRSCEPVTVAITGGPTRTAGTGTFGTVLQTNQSVTSIDGVDAFLWVTYTNPDENQVATGEVTVTAGEQTRTIPITANTIPRPRALIALSLDQSGSMGGASGFPAPFDTREAVLKFSALPIADVLHDDDGIGMVTFDEDDHPLMAVDVAGPLIYGSGRAAARTAILGYQYNPQGLTAIGDGVAAANALVTNEGGYDVRATVVLTDGHETASRYLSDVGEEITERVYAIGLGTADQIRPAALSTVTDGSGGYLLLTGQMDADDQFLLAKYYLQILAGVRNVDIVLDPDGILHPGTHDRIPFRLNEQDIASDVILVSTFPRAIRFALETPAGDLVEPPAATAAGMSFALGPTSAMYRFTLPVAAGSGAHGGRWHAHLAIDTNRLAPRTAESVNSTAASVLTRGIRYSLNVHAWSNLRLRAVMQQTANVPGAELRLRVRLTEVGIPLERPADVRAEIRAPDGSRDDVRLSPIGAGSYEHAWTAAASGVYRCRVRARGWTRRGSPFTREQLVTGQVWRSGADPAPSEPGGPGRGDGADWCELLRCVGAAMGEGAWKRLAALDVDVDALRRCLADACRERDKTRGSPDLEVARRIAAALARLKDT